MEESLERTPTNLKEKLETRLLNALKSLENDDVGLKLQLKMHEFIDSTYKKLKCDKEKKGQTRQNDQLLMMQGIRPSSLTKKLAKVNMSNIFLELGKAKNVKIFVLELNNYYDVQRPEVDKKVVIAVTFLKDRALEWWTRKNAQELEVVANLRGAVPRIVETIHVL